jgi:hypothetical protein
MLTKITLRFFKLLIQIVVVTNVFLIILFIKAILIN